MKTNAILAGLLAAQALLAVATRWGAGAEPPPAAPLVSLDRAAITEITVSAPGRDGAPDDVLRLALRDGAWVIATSGDYPADPTRVADLLDDLAAVQVRDPVATRREAHRELSVAEDDWDRKVELAAGDRRELLWLGGGTGKAAWARRGGEEEVYAARGLSTWSIGARPRSWYDPVYLEQEADALTAFSLRGPDRELALARAGDAWTLRDDPARPLDPQKVADLLRKALTLRVADLPGPGAPSPEGGLAVEWSGEAEVAEGAPPETFTGGYTVGAEEIDGRRAVRAVGRPPVLVGAAALRPLLEANAEGLAAGPP